MQTHRPPKSGLPEVLRAVPPWIMRQRLESALERLLSAAEAIVADLDELDGDPDYEEQCEDEGAPTGDDEPEDDHIVATYLGGDIDQTQPPRY